MAAATHLGIDTLASLQSVMIKQKVTYFSLNRYKVMAPDGAVILYAKATSGAYNCSDLIFSTRDRAFEISVCDTRGKEVIHLSRPFRWGLEKMEVTVCGTLVSVVRKKMAFFSRVLKISDASDRPLMRVKGSVCGGDNFRIQNMERQQVGLIAKRWSGFWREMCTTADSYDITFPPDASVGVKAAIIGTCILIDFLYYEEY